MTALAFVLLVAGVALGLHSSLTATHRETFAVRVVLAIALMTTALLIGVLT